jgi:hypothetical protein
MILQFLKTESKGQDLGLLTVCTPDEVVHSGVAAAQQPFCRPFQAIPDQC